MSIANAINQLLLEKNMSKYRVAKNSGIAQTTLSEITSGKNKNPTLETLKKIADGIGVNLSCLVIKAEEVKEGAYENE